MYKRFKINNDVFFIEAFIEKGYPLPVLKVLNNIWIYMKVLVLSDTSKHNGLKISNWALRSEVNATHEWDWPP